MRGKPVGTNIKLFDGLFLIVVVVDLVIIELVPSCALKLFGTVMTDPSAFLITLHFSVMHLLIDYEYLVATLGFGVGSGLCRVRSCQRSDEPADFLLLRAPRQLYGDNVPVRGLADLAVASFH